MKVKSLAEALTRGGPLIFVDDIIQRGSSAISIFESLLDLPLTQDLNEERAAPLSQDTRQALLTRDIAIVTSAGISTGVERLESTLRGYGLKVRVYAHTRDADLPTVRSVLATEAPERVESFIDQLRTIGADLVDGERSAAERVFGYGNEGLLVVSAFNTPTMTLTALWKAGSVDEAAWRPLFPRRPKK